ncbi:hypothetical protein [Aestuariispira ectoiniformans]|uniref:hypothetical protein n=1 Tax=Aestuariispira ectoiniformans TaxID=2775080 RepID=UPI00223A9416|nr:hypothetical protein [Aestuariispira ectoiniformans]
MHAIDLNNDQDWLSNLFKQDLSTNGWNVAELLPSAANDDVEEVDLLDSELAYWLMTAKKKR